MHVHLIPTFESEHFANRQYLTNHCKTNFLPFSCKAYSYNNRQQYFFHKLKLFVYKARATSYWKHEVPSFK